MNVGDVIQEGPWEGFEVISVYTRAQALADGVIVDVAEIVPDEPLFAAQAGLKVPVALTATVAALVRPTGREENECLQDLKGRLWDLLSMARLYGRRTCALPYASSGEWLFPCVFWLAGRPEYGRKAQRTLRLKATVSGGDDGEPVLTIGLPHED